MGLARDVAIGAAQGVRASVTKPTIELVLVGSPMAKGRPRPGWACVGDQLPEPSRVRVRGI